MPAGEARPPSPVRPASPRREDRRRSRSPRRDAARPGRKEGGFKWKERRRNEDDNGDREAEGRLGRGYREQYRDRSPRRNREADDGAQEPTKGEPDQPKKDKKDKKERKEKKEKQSLAVAPPGEPMIIVNINDRLGTKAAIPCYASDPIKLFKAQVAARIGREPHEILLKRQGERPFKDQLTLEDYGVSNGVQLDLEVDTGD